MLIINNVSRVIIKRINILIHKIFFSKNWGLNQPGPIYPTSLYCLLFILLLYVIVSSKLGPIYPTSLFCLHFILLLFVIV